MERYELRPAGTLKAGDFIYLIIGSPQQAGHDIHDWIASAFSFGESVSS